MSLRAQIHSAIDEVAPADPSLPREMVALVRSHEGRMPGRPLGIRRWSVPARRFASLVAAVLVIVLMVGLVLTGRLFRDQGTLGTAPHTVDQALISQLRERPLVLPTVQAGAVCPDGPYTPFHQFDPWWGYGSGPVYSEGSGTTYGTARGTYFETIYSSDAGISGPALVRARDLQTNQTVVFVQPDNYNSGTPIGKTVGVDTVIGQVVQLHAELLLDPSRESVEGWQVIQGLPKGSSGCIGFQINGFSPAGKAFTEVFVVSYLLMQ